MVGHAHANGSNPVLLRPFHRFAGGQHGQHVANAVMPVDHRHGAGIHEEFGFGQRIHDLVAQALQGPAQAQHAMRLVPPQIRLHQRVGQQARIRFRHARPGVNRRGKFVQPCGINPDLSLRHHRLRCGTAPPADLRRHGSSRLYRDGRAL